MDRRTDIVLAMNFSSHPSGDHKPFFLQLLLFHTQGKPSTMRLKRIELNLSPPCCHSVFKVPVVPLAYLRPVNLTQLSSPEDLGSNKGLTPWPPKLLPHWRRWLALPQPSSPHAIPAPAMSFPFLPCPSFTVILLCLCILLFFAAFVSWP